MAESITVSNEGPVEARVTDETNVDKQVHDISISNIPPPVVKGSDSIYLDSSITFENYVYWAKRSREVEKTISTADAGFAHLSNMIRGRKTSEISALTRVQTREQKATITAESNEKSPATPAQEGNNNSTRDGWGIAETEWEQAQRALRTATWGSIFFLITADILGPSNVPWAISKMGYGPGFALFTVFGGLSCYSGLQMWKVYMCMDATRFPLRNYGDAAFRVYGAWARILVNLLQVFQLLLNVVQIIVNNGQGLAQMAVGKDGKGYICFMGAEAVLMGIGLVAAQIRTLQRLAFVTAVGIVSNFIIVVMTMIVVHQYPPNYSASLTSYGTVEGPVVTSANWPVDANLQDKVNGMMNCIFAFGGATIFYELMAEMRRPYDFWKGFIISEIFIYFCYLITGMVVYSAQGQFTFNPAYQGISNSAYAFQTMGNAINLIAAVVSGLLYGNIGLKVFYSAELHDVFHLPPLHHRSGKLVWAIIVPIWWDIAWLLAAAVPQISYLGSFVGAACIMPFTYTFPPLLLLGYNAQNDAMLPGEDFNPQTGQVQRLDHGFKRLIRGFKRQFAWNSFYVIYALASIASAGLGIWASITAMHKHFAEGQCHWLHLCEPSWLDQHRAVALGSFS